MTAISAIRETEAWSTASIVAALVLLIIVIGVVAWSIRRFMNDIEE